MEVAKNTSSVLRNGQFFNRRSRRMNNHHHSNPGIYYNKDAHFGLYFSRSTEIIKIEAEEIRYVLMVCMI